MEPVLQRLKEVYGDQVKVTYRMGGMTDNIREWRKEYNSETDEALRKWISDSARATSMPVDADYIVKTKVKSSFPACLAVKAAQLQGDNLADAFYRRMMETIQVESTDANRENVYLQLAAEAGLEPRRLSKDINSSEVMVAFERDRAEMNVNYMDLVYTNRSTGKSMVVSRAFDPAPHIGAVDKLTSGKHGRRTPLDILEYFDKRRTNLIHPVEVSRVFDVAEEAAGRRLKTLETHGLLAGKEFAFGKFWRASPKLFSTKELTVEQVKASHVTETGSVSSKDELAEVVVDAVKGLYTEVALHPEKSYHFPLGRRALKLVGYPDKEVSSLPESVVESFAGVGYPHASDAIKKGSVVLDVGSGSGTDVLVASLRTGPEGRVTGLDITDAMISKAEANIRKVGVKNIRIVKGDAVKIPFDDNTFDVVTSNGVLNLVPDKPLAFSEIYRVLKPGGRIQIADIVVQKDVQKICGLVPQLWADCIGGAAVESEYLDTIRRAGFENSKVIRRVDYFAGSQSENTRRLTRTFEAESVVITGEKPSSD